MSRVKTDRHVWTVDRGRKVEGRNTARQTRQRHGEAGRETHADTEDRIRQANRMLRRGSGCDSRRQRESRCPCAWMSWYCGVCTGVVLGERLHGVTGRATHALWTMQSMLTRVVIELLFFPCLFVCVCGFW